MKRSRKRMGVAYDKDVVAWATEQAALLRAGQFSAIDIEHIAEEIEDVGKSEQRELANRMALLLSHLLKWKYQPERRSNSWLRTIREQRRAILAHMEETPSLRASLERTHWCIGVWADAVAIAVTETGLEDFPEYNPWPMPQILSLAFLPD